jgi:hypothetical protein
MESATGRRARKGPIEGRARERQHVHMLGARLAQRAGAFVDGRARRVDVVNEREAARAGARGECAAHVAAARRRIEPALRSHSARAPEERHHGHLPPASELARQLRRGVGSAQQQAVTHGGHDGDRVDRGSRQLVHHQRGGQPRG